MRRCFVALGCFLASIALGQSSPRDAEARARYEDLAAKVSKVELEENLIGVLLQGNRLAGTAGEAKTLRWTADRLREIGLRDVHTTSFKVATLDPASIADLRSPDGGHLRLYPLWPNLVSPSTCDLKSVDVLDGLRLEGHDVNGQVVVLPFGSKDQWRRAAKLGAAAIIFFDDGQVTRTEAELKVAQAPIRVPRFYFNGPAREIQKWIGAKVSLRCDQKWVEGESGNLEATLPGETDETILLAAYADSMSVTPGLNPGAQQATGLVALLETLRILRDQPRKRTIKVAILGSHFLGLRGAREYVATWGNRAPIVAGLTLDLSGGSSSLGSFGRGWFYETRDDTRAVVSQFSRILREHATVMWDKVGVRSARECLIDTVNNSDGRPWKNTVPGRFAVDAEPFVLAQLPVLTIATTEDLRALHDTPKDTLDRVRMDVLLSQTRRVVCFADHLANDTRARGDASIYRLPTQPSIPQRLSLVGGFATIEGRTLLYDPAKSFLPSIPVSGALAVLLGRSSTFMGVRGDLLEITNAKGGFRFDGVPLSNTYLDQDRLPTQVSAFQIGLDGTIQAAPAEGLMGSADYPTEFKITTTTRSSPLVLFRCSALDLIGISDPQSFQPIASFDLLDARTNGTPARYGLFQRNTDPKKPVTGASDACLFVEPNQKFHIVGRSSEGELRFLLKDQSADSLNPMPELANTGDLLSSSDERLARFTKYRIVSKGVSELQERSKEAEAQAERAAEKREWERAEQQGRAAWGYALRAYPIVRGFASDVVAGVLFYLLLLMPFSYFGERLLVGSRKLTAQIAWTLGIFCVAFLILRLIHPAFEIMPNPWIVFIAFVMAALSLFVAVFLLGKFDSSLTTARAATQGVLEADVRRAGVAMAAFQVGIAGMRRRQLRTALTILTLVAMTFIVLSFTSIVPEVAVRTQTSKHAATYEGALVRAPDLGPLSPALVDGFINEAGPGAELSRRATYEGADTVEAATLSLSHGHKSVDFRAVQGIDPSEPLIRASDLKAGRWPRAGERSVVVLPSSISDSLGVGVGGSVDFAGQARHVIGVFDETSIKTRRDLDGDGLFPPDFNASRRLREQAGSANSAFINFQRLDPAVCILAPADDVLELTGVIRSVAVTGVKMDLQELMPRLRLNLYASNASGMVEQFSALPGSRGTGFGMVLVQMAIAALFVLNTMIAGVYERRKEIGILSSIGLAPNHIGALFFAESAVYGVMGSVLGYFAAQGTTKILILTGAMPSLQLNFSSTSAVLSAGIVMAVVLVSTIYPAKVAARIAAPARDESILKDPPEGDLWEVRLPFTVGKSETGAALSYLAEWLSAHEKFSLGAFVTEQTIDNGDSVTCISWLAPFDLGVSQGIDIRAVAGGAPDTCALTLTLTRLSGEPQNWIKANERFVDSVRRQFLAWRTAK